MTALVVLLLFLIILLAALYLFPIILPVALYHFLAIIPTTPCLFSLIFWWHNSYSDQHSTHNLVILSTITVLDNRTVPLFGGIVSLASVLASSNNFSSETFQPPIRTISWRFESQFLFPLIEDRFFPVCSENHFFCCAITSGFLARKIFGNTYCDSKLQ